MRALTLAVVLCSGCPGDPASAPLTTWEGPGFSIAYPRGWRVHVEGGGVTFEGTRREGEWTLGPEVRVERDEQASTDAVFNAGGGSHLWSATLTVGRSGHRLAFRQTWRSDEGRSEREAERALRALADRMLPTLKRR